MHVILEIELQLCENLIENIIKEWKFIELQNKLFVKYGFSHIKAVTHNFDYHKKFFKTKQGKT